MANSSDSVNSWPGFVGQLNKTFMLVRDAFGYALPGGVFLAIGLMYGRFNLWQVRALLLPYHMPIWMAFIAIVAACYVAGDIMAATAYFLFMLAKYAVWMCDRHWPELVEYYEDKRIVGTYLTDTGATLIKTSPNPSWRTWLTEWLADHPTEVRGDLLKIHSKHTEFTDILDRRETLNILTGSLAAALLTGWLVFHRFQWPLHTILWVAGVIVTVQFLTGLPHLRRVADAIREANKDVPPPSPDFEQSLQELIKAAKDIFSALKSGAS